MSGLRERLVSRRMRRRVAARAARDLTPPPPAAFAAFGEGSVIVPPARVSGARHISIGERVVIHEHSWLSVVEGVEGVTPALSIGDDSRLGRMLTIACIGAVEIGPQVLTADRVFIGDTFHHYVEAPRPVIEQPLASPEKVTIERGAFLGVGSIVLPGVTIGAGAYVGAGAVVTADVPARTVVVGNPARAVRRHNGETGRWESVGHAPDRPGA